MIYKYDIILIVFKKEWLWYILFGRLINKARNCMFVFDSIKLLLRLGITGSDLNSNVCHGLKTIMFFA